MFTNLQVRVESDPMGVPMAAAMSTGRGESFETVLQEAVDAEPDARTAGDDARANVDESADDIAPIVDQAAEEQPEPPAADVSGATEIGEEPHAAAPERLAAGIDINETTRRGEPGRQAIAGKGTDSPRSSSSASEPLVAAFVAHTAAANAAPAPLPGAQPAVQAVSGPKAAGQVAARGLEADWQRLNTPTRAPAVTAGYRTSQLATAELLEQARESVFKQILMKLFPDGGEMRVRLQPPELGELDLRMVVEGGNRLSLSIAAERGDMAQLIQRHLDELKHTLRQAGLEVTDAQVSTRDEHAGRQSGHDSAFGRPAGADAAEQSAADFRSRAGGYVTAEGLDFWV